MRRALNARTKMSNCRLNVHYSQEDMCIIGKEKKKLFKVNVSLSHR